MNAKIKTFDCVEMKRRIQEKIYEETRNMSREEYLAFVRRRVDEGMKQVMAIVAKEKEQFVVITVYTFYFGGGA